MESLLNLLENKFKSAITTAFSKEFPIIITQSTQEKFGHYQCNSAMPMAKTLKKNPREIAQIIIDNIEKEPLIEKLEIAGPGFINITIRSKFLGDYLDKIVNDQRLGIPLPEKPQKVIVEFSSPNTAKELHVGHLRSTIIGDCIARLFEFLGHDVLRLNHIGDWGTAFGMLIAYMKEEAPEVLTGTKNTDLTHLVTWYKASKKKFDEDPDFKKRSQLEVVELQGGNQESLKAWKIICVISEKSYNQIYELLNVKLQTRGESFYNSMLPDLIKDLESKKLITVSEGAKCIFIEEYKNRQGEPMPLMVQKSDGGYTYDTTDLAALKHRIEIEKADRIIILTDAGQALHFNLLFKAAEKAGYYHPSKTHFDHVTFGLVLGPDGKKFRTRAGDTEPLINLLYNAIDEADKILREKKPELSQEERHQLAKDIGINAIKYSDLSSHRISDYTFSYDRMLKFEGNTAAYLMYSYVRTQSILRKSSLSPSKHFNLKHPSEISLAIHLAQFNEALQLLTNDLLPNRLTDYLYTLSNKFNAFHRDCRVIDSEEEVHRLLLCDLTAKTLKQGLHLLGVNTVESM